jgi:hypothetical protein
MSETVEKSQTRDEVRALRTMSRYLNAVDRHNAHSGISAKAKVAVDNALLDAHTSEARK